MNPQDTLSRIAGCCGYRHGWVYEVTEMMLRVRVARRLTDKLTAQIVAIDSSPSRTRRAEVLP